MRKAIKKIARALLVLIIGLLLSDCTFWTRHSGVDETKNSLRTNSCYQLGRIGSLGLRAPKFFNPYSIIEMDQEVHEYLKQTIDDSTLNQTLPKNNRKLNFYFASHSKGLVTAWLSAATIAILPGYEETSKWVYVEEEDRHFKRKLIDIYKFEQSVFIHLPFFPFAIFEHVNSSPEKRVIRNLVDVLEDKEPSLCINSS